MFAYVAHPEHLPRYGGPLWLAADLEDRRGGDPLITLRGYFAGLPVEAVIRTASRAPHSVDVTQVRGTLRGFSQRFTVESGDDGTVLSCRVEVDPGIPMVSDEAAKHFLTQYVERMLDRLRLAAERRPPSRRPVRPAVKSELAAIASGDADEPAPDETAVADATATASEPVRQDGGLADGASGGTFSEPASPPERTAASPPAQRPTHRPMPPRRPRPPRSSGGAGTAGGPPRPAETGAVSPGHGAASDAASPVQGRRRRRRRRRRGRGSGEPGGGPPGAGAG